MTHNPMSPAPDDDRRTADDKAAELFLDLRARLQEHGGVHAIQDEMVREGVIGLGPKLWVKVTRVSLVEDRASLRPPDGLEPILRFVVSDKDHRPLHRFAVEREIAVDALQLAHPSNAGLRIPAPAFEYQDVATGLIRAGDRRFLSMTPVTLDDSPDASFARGGGIRFEISDVEMTPLYSFTVDWPLAFLVINAAYPEHG